MEEELVQFWPASLVVTTLVTIITRCETAPAVQCSVDMLTAFRYSVRYRRTDLTVQGCNLPSMLDVWIAAFPLRKMSWTFFNSVLVRSDAEGDAPKEPGIWNLEPGTWNLEPGTWNLGR